MATWSGAYIVLISLIGWGFLGQSLDFVVMAGIAPIIACVDVINLLLPAPLRIHPQHPTICALSGSIFVPSGLFLYWLIRRVLAPVSKSRW